MSAKKIFNAKTAAILVSALLACYLVVTGTRAAGLLLEPNSVLKLLGAGLLILPLLGAWALIRELHYGRSSEKLAAAVDPDVLKTFHALPTTAAGRIDPHAAEDLFEQYREQAHRQPQLWQSWYGLALAYDACRDRRRARAALRKAISLYRADALPHTSTSPEDQPDEPHKPGNVEI